MVVIFQDSEGTGITWYRLTFHADVPVVILQCAEHALRADTMGSLLSISLQRILLYTDSGSMVGYTW